LLDEDWRSITQTNQMNAILQNNSNYQIMKKLVLVLALIATFTITSCKERDVEGETETTDTTTFEAPTVDTVETTTTVEVDTLSTE